MVYDNKRHAVTSWNRLALLGCERCGLVFSHPLPTEAELNEFYSAPDGWESRLGDDDTSVDQQAELARKLGVKHERYSRARDMLAEYLTPRDRPRRALDFGCGLGAWLDVLQDDGWLTTGIEPGPQQREIAGRRHCMMATPPPEETFDLVVVNHVFEHLRDPMAVMRAIAACTVEGGRIFVSVPDLGRLPDHGKWGYVKNERHICSYTVDALESLLGLAGFRLLAHLDTPEWDALGESERWHLKVLAEKTGQVVHPAGEPLRAALDALRAYEPEAQRLEDEASRAAAEKKAARVEKEAARVAAQEHASAQARPPTLAARIGGALRALRSRIGA